MQKYRKKGNDENVWMWQTLLRQANKIKFSWKMEKISLSIKIQLTEFFLSVCLKIIGNIPKSVKNTSLVYQQNNIRLVSHNLSLLSLHDRPLNISIHKTKGNSQNKS